ncbi:MAG: hypothetical protein AB7Y46_08065 [Armatimonadota bacterium]
MSMTFPHERDRMAFWQHLKADHAVERRRLSLGQDGRLVGVLACAVAEALQKRGSLTDELLQRVYGGVYELLGDAEQSPDVSEARQWLDGALWLLSEEFAERFAVDAMQAAARRCEGEEAVPEPP